MNQRNEEFLQRLLARRKSERAHYESMLEAVPEAREGETLEGTRTGGPRDALLETIVRRERPVLFVKGDAIHHGPVKPDLGAEAEELIQGLEAASAELAPLFPLVGRIDVTNFPGSEYVGTGWFVDADVVVTNRHVASLIARWDGRRFAFSRGVGGQPIGPSLCTGREIDEMDPTVARVFAVREVLYIEPDSGPNDIAFIRVERRVNGSRPPAIRVSRTDVDTDQPVCVVGYPARASRRVIPDQQLMQELYGGHYDVKRIAPGLSIRGSSAIGAHDCTTLGGNSGSVVVELATGNAVGLHFAGLYMQANYAVPASVLHEYVERKRWNAPPEIETRPRAPLAPAPAVAISPSSPPGVASASVTVHVPLTITVSVGQPVVGAPGAPSTPSGPLDPPRVEAAAQALYESRIPGVLATRVGFPAAGETFGDAPFIAASVMPDRLAEVAASAPAEFQGVPVRYFPAEVGEQLEALVVEEAAATIAYDDHARRSGRFSFKTVNEKMDVTLHVGPERSWSELERFIQGAEQSLVSGIYEFHAVHVKDALEERLAQEVSLKLVMDNTTFSKIRHADEEFDRVEVFRQWEDDYAFERVVAPEGSSGLIYNSYHIKVTVRDDDTVWLSSGNWKMGSSQPLLTQEELDNATHEDLRGNREWHVVVRSPSLATRFKSHLLQDFDRSVELGGRPVPRRFEEETFVLVPAVEEMVLERRPPSRVLDSKSIRRKVKVKPLLTPDRGGEVYCDAVLELIESAKESLLFQIPYIGMPPSPRANRGFIDDLIKALTRKLKTLDDARVLLRSGGSRLSSPRHAAWYFKSKGVDIDERLRVIENHHTKGMVVDGKRVLVGSHNWSGAGVTINRDASLLFYDEEVAGYYAEAFEIDWARSNKIKPVRFVAETLTAEGIPVAAIPHARVSVSEWMSDD